jgi:hypothetical protein
LHADIQSQGCGFHAPFNGCLLFARGCDAAKLFEPADEYSVQRAYQVPQLMCRRLPDGRYDGEDIAISDGGNGVIPVEI